MVLTDRHLFVSHVSKPNLFTQDTSVCQIWVWLSNSHQEKTKLLDMLELQVREQIQYSKVKSNKGWPSGEKMLTFRSMLQSTVCEIMLSMHYRFHGSRADPEEGV